MLRFPAEQSRVALYGASGQNGPYFPCKVASVEDGQPTPHEGRKDFPRPPTPKSFLPAGSLTNVSACHLHLLSAVDIGQET